MISHAVRVRITLLAAIVTMIAVSRERVFAQTDISSSYRLVDNWGRLPAGRTWGKSVGISIDRDGNIWDFERCGGDSCIDSKVAPILKFDPSGKLLKSFAAGMVFVYPHGIYADPDGNVWVTDARGEIGKGRQVFKFSPEGELLLTLGKAGVGGDGPGILNEPTDVVVAPNGDIFVTDGHDENKHKDMEVARIAKFSKDGKFIKRWGKLGSAPGDLDSPHCIAMDSAGRLFVCDRHNNRIQIFDQDGKFLAEWKQFGRPAGIFIDANDVIYVADSQSDEKVNPGFKQGIRIGSAKDGEVTGFLPGAPPKGASSGKPLNAVADAMGNIYWVEEGVHSVWVYVKK